MYGPHGDGGGTARRGAPRSAKVTVPEIRARKGGPPLAMVTAYDYTMARLLDEGGADLLLVWCLCDDQKETERRIMRRQGREADPACEASDRSVFVHIARLWEPPSHERCGSAVVPICTYDTQLGTLRWLRQAGQAVRALVEEALTVRPPTQLTRR